MPPVTKAIMRVSDMTEIPSIKDMVSSFYKTTLDGRMRMEDFVNEGLKRLGAALMSQDYDDLRYGDYKDNKGRARQLTADRVNSRGVLQGIDSIREEPFAPDEEDENGDTVSGKWSERYGSIDGATVRDKVNTAKRILDESKQDNAEEIMDEKYNADETYRTPDERAYLHMTRGGLFKCEITPLSEMIDFKKSGHDTSASLAKMLWAPGTDLRRDTPQDTARAVGDEIMTQRDSDSHANQDAANERASGIFDSEENTPGVNTPRDTSYESPNEKALEAKGESEYVTGDDAGLKSEFSGTNENPEGWLDIQYALDHPTEPESIEIIAALKEKYPNARALRDL